MKKNLTRTFLVLLIALISTITFAQEETEKKVEKPVRDPFMASTLIENQTIVGASAKKLELIIHHRMGSVGNGLTDLYGVYGASNIRMGLQYGITDKLTLGIGTEKNNKYNDLNAKYTVFQQTRSGSMPIALSVHANVSIDARDEEIFGTNYEFTDRISYFAQVIVARKFTDAFSLQLAPSYSHFNSVDSTFQNDKIGVMIGGKYTIYNSISAIFEYNQPISINPARDYHKDIESGIAVGFEIATSTHAFQIFATNYQGIMAQNNNVMNTRKFDSDGILIGFNVNVKF